MFKLAKISALSLLLIGGFIIGINLSASTPIKATSNNSVAFNFIAYGDTRGSIYTDVYTGAVSDLHDDIVTAYLQKDPELIIHTGDLAGAFRYPLQVEAFNDSLAEVWNAAIPIYFTTGNHDRDFYPEISHDPFSNYSSYIANHSQLNATLTAALNDTGETIFYYSFDYENVHFIVLNIEWDWDGNNLTLYEPQLNWLLADLTASKADFTVVTFHRPAYSVRAGASYRWAQAAAIRGVLHDYFVQYGVDLVFTGHDHMYYRTLRDGIYYVTTAGGGAPQYEYDTAAPDWQNSDVAYREHHYCNIEVNSSSVSVTGTSLNGTSLDSFSIDKPADPTSSGTTLPSSETEETSNGSSAPGWTALTGIMSMIAIAVVTLHRRR
ncbi:MAG: metallophosphoesterase family protein [Candidatus Hodarchaeales archaeon]|jgi:predicted MPP superfamily phosphohydrolase